MKHSENPSNGVPEPRRSDRPLDNGRRTDVKKKTELRESASRVSDKPAPRRPPAPGSRR